MEQMDRKLYWQKNIDLFRQSGMTPKEFCGKHSLSTKTFFKWKKRFTPTIDSCPKTLQLIPIDLKPSLDEAPSALNQSSGIRLDVKGLNIRLDCGFDVATLKRLLSMLEGEVSC